MLYTSLELAWGSEGWLNETALQLSEGFEDRPISLGKVLAQNDGQYCAEKLVRLIEKGDILLPGQDKASTWALKVLSARTAEVLKNRGFEGADPFSYTTWQKCGSAIVERFMAVLEDSPDSYELPPAQKPFAYGPAQRRLQFLARQSRCSIPVPRNIDQLVGYILAMPLAEEFEPQVRRVIVSRVILPATPRKQFIVALEAELLARWGCAETKFSERLSFYQLGLKRELIKAMGDLVGKSRSRYAVNSTNELVAVTLPLRGDAGYQQGFPTDRVVGQVTFGADPESAEEFEALNTTANAVGLIARFPAELDPRRPSRNAWHHHIPSGGDQWEEYIGYMMTDRQRRLIRRAAISVISSRLM